MDTMFAVMRPMSNARIAAIAVALSLAGLPASAADAPSDASPWDGDGRTAVRLIAASSARDSGTYRAGIEIRLAPGWKTYWRYPGDAGVPPRLDFEHSDNVKSATVLWPAPQLFAEGDGDTIGYKNEVILPLRVVPRDPNKPVTLRLKLDYAVCEKLCVPEEASAELTLTGQHGAEETRLAAAEARVPRAAALGDGQAFGIRNVQRAPSQPSRVFVDVAAPAQAKVALFAEGPTPDWALPVPKPVAGAPVGQQRYQFALDGLPTGASAQNVSLKLTATAGEEAIEVPVHLD
jgi:DsbC/DsbD-like thiol-disulfide interchange protein